MDKDIEKLYDNIFEYNIKEAMNQLVMLLNQLEKIQSRIPTEYSNTFNDILNYINIGIENQDYLLAADIFKYELQPFLKELQLQ